MVHGEPVDLGPLFRWWANHQGERPLKSWTHVTGIIVGTNGMGWVVGGSSDTAHQSEQGADSSKLELKNPPWRELAEFQKLSTRAKTLRDERAKVAAQETQAKTRLEVINREQRAYGRATTAYRRLAAEERRLRPVEREARRQLTAIDNELKDINSRLKAYPNNERYQVDCFALQTTEREQGLRVFDHGVVPK